MRRHESYLAQCPFYSSEDSNRICCEGVEEDSTTHVVFSQSKRKAEYCKRVCRDNFKSCRVYNMLCEKYEEGV